MLRFIVSVTGWIDAGSCKADIIVGGIYFVLFFSAFFTFFFPIVERPISTFFKSHIKIWPFTAPAMTIVGSLGLN